MSFYLFTKQNCYESLVSFQVELKSIYCKFLMDDYDMGKMEERQIWCQVR